MLMDLDRFWSLVAASRSAVDPGLCGAMDPQLVRLRELLAELPPREIGAFANRFMTPLSATAAGTRAVVGAGVDGQAGGMQHHRQELWFETTTRRAFVNITDRVSAAVADSGVEHGLCLVNAMHITASVFINDHESGLWEDYEEWLETLAPFDPDPPPQGRYRHNRTGEDNADAHLKRQIMGREVTVAITDGRLDLGPWEQIFYGEFDGRRRKRALIKIIGE